MPRWLLSLIFASLLAQSPVGAQDTLGEAFRETISQVAAVAGWRDLRGDDRAVRELRVYQGFGIAIPNSFARIWEDKDGRSHVQVGYFWPSLTSGMAKDGRNFDREFRRLMDTTFACANYRRSAEMNMCAPRGKLADEEVAALSKGVWALELDSLRKPLHEPMGFDGWSVVVEYRSVSGYRSAYAWQPDSKSDDAAVRLIARVGALASEAAERVRREAVRR